MQTQIVTTHAGAAKAAFNYQGRYGINPALENCAQRKIHHTRADTSFRVLWKQGWMMGYVEV